MQMNESCAFVVQTQQDGKRLDHVLREILPLMGTRGAKRLVNNSCVTVDGKIARPTMRVASGNIIKVLPCRQKTASTEARILKKSQDFYFIFKPRNMHCAAIKGSMEKSVEEILPDLVFPENGRLLQRLDYGTGGIVLAATNNAAYEIFNTSQNEGTCQKKYLALVYGKLSETITVNNALETSHRKKSRILAREADPTRHSIITPIKFWKDCASLPWQILNLQDKLASLDCREKGISLVGCQIKKGARHQIRAHASHAGFPLVGDGLYGKQNDTGDFFLHQAWLSFADHFCLCLPDWLNAESVPQALQWLETGKRA